MKTKTQLLKELESFITFAESLLDFNEDFLATPICEDLSIKAILSNICVQDKMYTDYYFPRFEKHANIDEYPKQTLIEEAEHMVRTSNTEEIIKVFAKTRDKLINECFKLPQELLHAFFAIDNVQFTLYDHIEHIIWNDFIWKEEILKATI